MPLPTSPQLSTPRLLLRPLQPSDLPGLWPTQSDPEVTRYLPHPAWQSEADAQAWWARSHERVQQAQALHLGLLRQGDQQLLGHLIVFRYDAESARAEVGYALGRAHWGQGYMQEAMGAVVSAAFQAWGLRRLEAEIDPRNGGSNALVRRLGFVHEGLARQRWVNQGVPCDVNLYGLLQTDTRAR
jgi:ribosomal-protein-alanine N-acetyltransferase